MEAYRISESISVDAVFDESAWQTAAIATDFIQQQPMPKEPSSQKSEVQVAYDNEAFYIAAKLYVEEGFPIYKELGQRDDLEVNAESFFVFFDMFDDDQNGLSFGVTSAGVQIDAKYSPSGEEDFQWDGVWESKTKVTDEGWFVEMKIPLFNLRFADKATQNWGLNFLRKVRETREDAYWNFVDQNVNGFVNQWGQLSNIQNIDPPLRLSFTPFVSTNFGKVTGNSVQTDFNAGMDVKYGINDSFTLDMTLIPDFGGVRSDEQILNLGPFEQRFDENRAFFTEGTELFGKNRLFYSRRIGQRPSGYSSAYQDLAENETVTENPNRAKLLNATKISGRTKNNVGLGFFNAVTNKTQALITDTLTGQTRMVQTGALTNYNILVAEKALKNASSVYIINTNVARAGNARDANVTGVGAQLRDKSNKYALEAITSYSQVFTTDEYNLKRNTRGFTSRVVASENEGNFTYGLGTSIESDKYNPNDLGILFAPNDFNQFAFARYGQNKPSNWYRQYAINLNSRRTGLFKPSVERGYRADIDGFVWLKSLAAVMVKASYTPGEKDYFEPQQEGFDTFFQRPTRTSVELGYSSNFAKRAAVEVRVNRGFGNGYIPIDQWEYSIQPRFRFNDKLRTIIDYRLQQSDKNVGFARKYNGETIMGTRDRDTHVTELNTEYKFNENMNLTLFGRYTWDRVNYFTYHTLLEDGKLSSPYEFVDAEDAPSNVNFSGFNLDAIFRWRFAPGSDIIAVYKKQLTDRTEELQGDYFRNFDQLFQQDQRDVLNLKLVYFFDYNKLRSKKS